ncbi:hypothetical protein QEZ54_08030 [Catellatospora sp. KI3]|uniref:hypothetical protein n=1 Tax=Catellatospora sp. KI3 TaxID=3041620 RepID=UPI002482C7CA|nr:hypothetical protein [Catellatospora sp. KI3]MDI1460909.1 hypothetical protein [Catellatospora sp. KI3]
MSTPDIGGSRDAENALTIALAEYTALNDLQKALRDQSAARFNFFLAIVTAAAAVSGGLASGGKLSEAAKGTLGTVGFLILVLGLSTFLRQVEFSQRGNRYAAATDTLRTYLARSCAPVAPYLIMPVIGDVGVIGTTYRRRTGVLRDAMSLPGTVGIINSALLALGAGFVTGIWLDYTIWPPAAAFAAFALSMVLHIGHLRRAFRRSRTEVAALLAARGLDADPN